MQANQSDLFIIDSFKHCPDCGKKMWTTQIPI